jgi:FTR1 family protein
MRRGLEAVFKSAQGTEWFSIPVFFVLLRETLEVMIILACMFCALQKLNLTSLKKWITYGAIAGLVVDVIIGAAMIAVFLTLKNNAFDSASDSEKIFEASLMLVSSLIVTVFALGLTKFISGLEGKFGAKLTKYTAEIESAQKLIDEKEKEGNRSSFYVPTNDLNLVAIKRAIADIISLFLYLR